MNDRSREGNPFWRYLRHHRKYAPSTEKEGTMADCTCDGLSSVADCPTHDEPTFRPKARDEDELLKDLHRNCSNERLAYAVEHVAREARERGNHATEITLREVARRLRTNPGWRREVP